MNYTQQLGLNAGQIAIDTAGRLQQQDKQRTLTGFMQEDRAAQQQQAQGDIQARQQAAELLQNGTPEQIAQFGIQRPDIMKDIISGANFIDESAKQSRLKYAQDVLSGSVNPRQAINDRIAQVENAGGDASGLKQTAQLSDEDIVKAAEKDLAVMNPKGYESYKKAIGGTPAQQTSEQKNFKQYQELKKTDPEAAKQFGLKAGFVKGEPKKELFKVENINGELTKLYRDGTEEKISPNQKVKTKDMKQPLSYRQAESILADAKEYQSKSAGFAMRLRDSIDSMKNLSERKDDPVDAQRAALIMKALGDGTIANMNLSPGEQSYVVNAKDALFAILRPETGAAITLDETKQYAQIYLPQPGDSKEVLATKKRKLENQFKAQVAKAPKIYDASRVIFGSGPDSSEVKFEADGDQQAQGVIIKAHPSFGDITEQDIQKTMQDNGMTREQVMQRLNNG